MDGAGHNRAVVDRVIKGDTRGELCLCGCLRCGLQLSCRHHQRTVKKYDTVVILAWSCGRVNWTQEVRADKKNTFSIRCSRTEYLDPEQKLEATREEYHLVSHALQVNAAEQMMCNSHQSWPSPGEIRHRDTWKLTHKTARCTWTAPRPTTATARTVDATATSHGDHHRQPRHTNSQMPCPQQLEQRHGHHNSHCRTAKSQRRSQSRGCEQRSRRYRLVTNVGAISHLIDLLLACSRLVL